MVIGKVGSKGELFPPKHIREQLGLKSGQKVVFRINNGVLIIEKVLSVDEILQKPKKAVISIEEIKQDRFKLSEDAVK